MRGFKLAFQHCHDLAAIFLATLGCFPLGFGAKCWKASMLSLCRRGNIFENLKFFAGWVNCSFPGLGNIRCWQPMAHRLHQPVQFWDPAHRPGVSAAFGGRRCLLQVLFLCFCRGECWWQCCPSAHTSTSDLRLVILEKLEKVVYKSNKGFTLINHGQIYHSIEVQK